MQDGIETSGAPEIEQLHHSAIADAGRFVQADAPMEAGPHSDDDADADGSPDAEFCRVVIAAALKRQAKVVHKTFHAKVEPLSDAVTAMRIANQAAMAPELQEQIAADLAQILDEYGLAKYVNAKASLIIAAFTYWWTFSDAKAEVKKLEDLHNPPQPQPAQ